MIFLVHGGAWRFGDKAARAVVEHKVARWMPKGFVVERLGEARGYTEAVESFLAGLDDSQHRLLARSPTATR